MTAAVFPAIEEARELARRGNLIPVYREVLADLETPVSVYLKIARGRYSFLLESVEGGERLARYSFLGTEPRLTATLDQGVATVRRAPGGGGRRGLASRPLGPVVPPLGPVAGREPWPGAPQPLGPVAGREPWPGTPAAGDGLSGEAIRQRFDDPLAFIRELLAPYRPVPVPDLPRFHGGAVGYLAYECARYFESLPAPERDDLGLPEAVLMLADTVVVFDHVKHRMRILSHADVGAHGGDVDAAYVAATRRIDALVERIRAPLGAPPGRDGGRRHAAPLASTFTKEAYEAAVRKAVAYVHAGDVIQVVPSQRLSRPVAAHPFSVYRALRAVNPSPYMYLLHLNDTYVVGASPEMLVQVEDGIVRTRPIAGTKPRGRNEREDEALARELLADEKERAEHIMLVDLGRNDVGRVCKPGTVRVSTLMDIEKYSHVMHIVSQVEGTLRDDRDAYDALRSCFPAGTVSGAPKIRAMEIIAELEPAKRGTYAGAVGYFSYGGNLDTAIAIRTMVIKDGVAHVQAGGGVVADSVPEVEYQETLNKAAALLRALDFAEEVEAVESSQRSAVSLERF